ncbi:MBL fold metallo-hydrolase [Chloroflexi bacterium TSY]|nr:MBL fold metallo-hydrolase [Chloroflexi bacterium TSY]
MSPPQLTSYILDTGYCLAHENLMIQGGARRQLACHSIVALLGHPEHGWLLWDTGYAPRMLEGTRRFPYVLYRWATPLYVDSELAVVRQLPRWGLTPADIQQIIISHFHADHLAGLHDFPTSRFVALQEAYRDVASRTGLSALRRAFLPSLLPPDFHKRLVLLPTFSGTPLPYLGPTHDLFDDGSLLLVRLPGHARGQLGLLAQTDRGRIFFVADTLFLRNGKGILFVDAIRASVDPNLAFLAIFSRDCRDFGVIYSDFGYRKQPISYLKIAQI